MACTLYQNHSLRLGRGSTLQADDDETFTGFLTWILGEEKNTGTGYLALAARSMRNNGWNQTSVRYPDDLDFVDEFCKTRKRTHHLYFCPTLLTSNKRVKQNVQTSRVLWADLDECPPEAMLVKPSLVVESSPGRYHAYWRLQGLESALDVQRINKRIAYFHEAEGCDTSGWDLTQLLRIPGTLNQKGMNLHPVKIHDADNQAVYSLSDFELYPRLKAEGFEPKPMPIVAEAGSPAEASITGRETLIKHGSKIPPQAWSLFEKEPQPQRRSHNLWALQQMLFAADLTDNEVFIVVKSAACNKFAHSDELTWKEVQRAHAYFKGELLTTEEEQRTQARELVLPDKSLLTDEEHHFAHQRQTIVEEYIEWAKTTGDAAPEYHEAGAFILLSTLMAGSVKLPTSFGTIKPNLWIMITGSTTLSRKAQPLTSKVLTPNGWTTMGELSVGDEVIGSNGKPTRVEYVYPQGELNSYEVTFNDGGTTECCAEHLWNVKEPGGGPFKTKTLQWLMDRPLKYGASRWIRQIPKVQPVEFEPKDLPLDPYLLGLLLGDGSFERSGSIKLTTTDQEIVDTVEKTVTPLGLTLNKIGSTKYEYLITAGSYGPRGLKNSISTAIEELGLRGVKLEDKFVPEIYLQGSVEQRLALLQGLMDSDGWVTNHRGVHFANASKHLTLAVQQLVWSLGGWSHYDGGHPTKYKNTDGEVIECRTSHQVSISMPLDMIPCRLERKTVRLEGKRSWSRPRSIRSIEPVGKKSMQCIKVAAEDGLYVTDDFILSHNSTAMDLAVDLLEDVDSDYMLATDGSIEGLLTSLSTRPGRASLFHRDEFSGMLEQMSKRDYYAGMLEVLTKLYDGKMQKRLLRRETIEVRNPCFILFAGGIKERIHGLISPEHVDSGFIPRFMFVHAEPDLNKLAPLGPPSTSTLEGRNRILERLRALHMHYNVTTNMFQGNDVPNTTWHVPSNPQANPVIDGLAGDGGTAVQTQTQVAPVNMTTFNKSWSAELTNDAWMRYNKIAHDLQVMGVESSRPDVMTAMMARLSISGLKMAILLAASDRLTDRVLVQEHDITQAFYYIDKWKPHTLDVVMNAGKSKSERELERVYDFVKNNPGVLRGNVMQVFHLKAREADGLFSTLEQRGLVRLKKSGKGEKVFPLVIEAPLDMEESNT